MRPDTAIADPAYQDALRWLYALSPNVRTAADIRADHPRKLARMGALLDRLGNPERGYRSVLVAGTKGKGSIAAMVESIVRAAGWRTGLVTSPHLVTWCERTRLDGNAIAPAEVGRLMPIIQLAAERLVAERPELGAATTFEAGLAVSLLAFAEHDVRIAVVEAGVGGGHDATNVLDPLAIALGPISYDHLGTLGDTLTAIASEKAAIMRTGRLAVSAAQPAEALAVVERVAAEHGARLELVGRDWRWQPDDDQPARGPFTIEGPRGRFANLTTPLLGRHQRENATAAVALATGLLEELAGTMASAPPSVEHQGCVGAGLAPPSKSSPRLVTEEAAVRHGLANVSWPGRLQLLQVRPTLIVDGAHNGDSAARLAEAVVEAFGERRRHLVFGTSVGKDLRRMFDALLPIASTLTLTRSHHERSVPLPDLAVTLAARGVETLIEPEVRDAVERALAEAAPDDLVIVTGSLFVVGEVLEAYGVDDAQGSSAGGYL
jgi:dihydrofolate synthase/folylpolyglutamate synthase